jgi:hypothetical protein
VVFESEREFRLALNLEFARLFTGRLKSEGVFASVDLKLLIERAILGALLSEKERDESANLFTKRDSEIV